MENKNTIIEHFATGNFQKKKKTFSLIKTLLVLIKKHRGTGSTPRYR